jgi:sec-independent protein translocase protein TatB
MVRQSELDEVKKQLESVQDGLDLKSLDPSRQIRDAIQDGVAEGEKAMTDAKAALDNPLAEPESAPQIAAEPEAAPVAASAEAAPSVEPAPAEPTPVEQSPVEHRPAKAAAE